MLVDAERQFFQQFGDPVTCRPIAVYIITLVPAIGDLSLSGVSDGAPVIAHVDYVTATFAKPLPVADIDAGNPKIGAFSNADRGVADQALTAKQRVEKVLRAHIAKEMHIW